MPLSDPIPSGQVEWMVSVESTSTPGVRLIGSAAYDVRPDAAAELAFWQRLANAIAADPDLIVSIAASEPAQRALTPDGPAEPAADA